jgi:hypothetical protein
MRRIGLVACVFVCLVVPPAGHAATPPGYTPIGMPATLSDIIFASDGTMYGTADGLGDSGGNPAVIWRSADHGRTWSAAYRLPSGWKIDLLQASPADPNTIYAFQTPPRVGQPPGTVERIDVRANRSVQLWLGDWLGVDAAGTAYGSARVKKTLEPAIVRCKRRVDACDYVKAPPFQTPAYLRWAIVDPSSAGVLVSSNRTASGTYFEISSDAGATWQQGAPAPASCCNIQFAGPQAHTFYVRDGTQLSVSHDSGFTLDATHTVPAGALIVGSHPSASFGGATTDPFSISGDEGATTRALSTPSGGWSLLPDPTDPNRLVSYGGDTTQISDDAGGSWRAIADGRFGSAPLDASKIGGGGRYLYAFGRGSLWHSNDMGATWGRTERPAGETGSSIMVSRDDPRVAYVLVSATDTGQVRTLDGGATWQAVSPSPSHRGVTWIEPGQPLHVYSFDGSDTVWESLDGAVTWTQTTQDHWCVLQVDSDTTSPTGERLRCNGFYQPADPLRPLPLPPGWSQGLVGSPDVAGALAVALPKNDALNHQILLGEFRSDWTWSSLLAPTGAFGPATETSDAVTAWPTPAGTLYYAYDAKTGSTWVRRGRGRWWRVQVAGRDVSVFSVLDATHLLVGTPSQYGERGVLDLAHPAVSPPILLGGAAKLQCSLSWSAADANASGITWLRDGTPVAGATGASYTPAARDAGHSVACQAGASTDFGSSVVTSDAFAVPPAKAALTGTARTGGSLRCGASSHITWLRDGLGVKGAHARTYKVRSGDRNHTLACQAKLADGAIARSRAALIGA